MGGHPAVGRLAGGHLGADHPEDAAHGQRNRGGRLVGAEGGHPAVGHPAVGRLAGAVGGHPAAGRLVGVVGDRLGGDHHMGAWCGLLVGGQG